MISPITAFSPASLEPQAAVQEVPAISIERPGYDDMEGYEPPFNWTDWQKIGETPEDRLGDPDRDISKSASVYASPMSGDAQIDSLLWGYKWGNDTPGEGATITYSFKTDETLSMAPGEPVFPMAGWTLNEEEKAATREALARWSAVANIKFVEVPETADAFGDLRFGGSNYLPVDVAAATLNYTLGDHSTNGDIWLGRWFHAEDQLMPSGRTIVGGLGQLQPGGKAFMVLMHEIGHALGLKHPFETYPQNTQVLDSALDTQRNTLLSYRHKFDFSAETPQALDIAAIQYLYGKNAEYRSGNDRYEFNDQTPAFYTLWDTGGLNTLDASSQDTAAKIDLRPGERSNLGAIIADTNFMTEGSQDGSLNTELPPPPVESNDYFVIAKDTLVQNAVGSSAGDSITGNDADNLLEGGGGDDVIDGGVGYDKAYYAISADPASVQWVADATLDNTWHAVNEEGRTLVNVSTTAEGKIIVEDVRADQDLLPGEARLGRDELTSIEELVWAAPDVPALAEKYGVEVGADGQVDMAALQAAVDAARVAQLAPDLGESTEIATPEETPVAT